jgi:hypothetical protein
VARDRRRAPAPALLAEHPDLAVRRGTLAGWPAGDERIYLVDPLGNLVLAWPRDPDIKKMSATSAACSRRRGSVDAAGGVKCRVPRTIRP